MNKKDAKTAYRPYGYSIGKKWKPPGNSVTADEAVRMPPFRPCFLVVWIDNGEQ